MVTGRSSVAHRAPHKAPAAGLAAPRARLKGDVLALPVAVQPADQQLAPARPVLQVALQRLLVLRPASVLNQHEWSAGSSTSLVLINVACSQSSSWPLRTQSSRSRSSGLWSCARPGSCVPKQLGRSSQVQHVRRPDSIQPADQQLAPACQVPKPSGRLLPQLMALGPHRKRQRCLGPLRLLRGGHATGAHPDLSVLQGSPEDWLAGRGRCAAFCEGLRSAQHREHRACRELAMWPRAWAVST